MLRVMGTPWHSPAERYLAEWVPRFLPYHHDLVRELALVEGQRVLVVSCGPGAEVLAVARAVGDSGHVRATDKNPDLLRLCDEQVKKAGFPAVTCEAAAPDAVGDGKWDAIICAFGIWNLEQRALVLKAWASGLAPSGKVGILTFSPPDENDPFELLARALHELEPHAMMKPSRIEGDRDAMQKMLEEGGLSLVRHTVLRHTITFTQAEDFILAIREGRTWRRVWEELGNERMGRVTARFFDRVGGPTEPLSFQPAVALGIAALPGAEVDLANRPHSITAPRLSTMPPSSRDRR